MSYNKKIWANGDLITKEGMNNIEYGIYDAHDKINAINNKVEENTTDTNTAIQDISDIKLQIGTEELTTTSKKIKGAINELDSQIKEKASKTDINLEDYDGLNKTEKLKNLINDVNLNYKTKNIKIKIPFGIEINEDIVIDGWENKNIEINGEIFFNNCNAIIFKRLNNSKVFINSVRGSEIITNNDVNNLNNDGICFSSCAYNDIHINKIYGFENGLILEGKDYSDGFLKGSFNNKISFNTILAFSLSIIFSSKLAFSIVSLKFSIETTFFLQALFK